MLKCSKTYRSLPEEERCSSLSPHVFTFSVYEHKGEVHLLLRSIIIVIIGLADGGKLSLAVIPISLFFCFFFQIDIVFVFCFHFNRKEAYHRTYFFKWTTAIENARISLSWAFAHFWLKKVYSKR